MRSEALTEDEVKWMREAVALGKQSVSEVGKISPKVGAVAVRDGTLLAGAYRGQRGEGNHAEYCLVQELASSGQALTSATVYTTLEPCTTRNHPKVPCAERLVEGGVQTVFIGMYDPDPRIHRLGWRRLLDSGVYVRDFDAELRTEIEQDNEEFIGKFQHGVASGSACFDYRLNGGRFEIFSEDRSVAIETRWTSKGASSIYAVGPNGSVAHARHARDLDEIDDVTALTFDSHSQPANVGEVVAFRSPKGYALVKVTDVKAGPDRGHDRTELCIEYELRLSE